MSSNFGEKFQMGSEEGRKALRYGNSIIPRTLKGAVACPDLNRGKGGSSNFNLDRTPFRLPIRGYNV